MRRRRRVVAISSRCGWARVALRFRVVVGGDLDALRRFRVARARLDRVVGGREPPAFVVIGIELAERRLSLAALRREAQLGAGLGDRLDPRADEDVQRLRLLQRIDGVVADVRRIRGRARRDRPG